MSQSTRTSEMKVLINRQVSRDKWEALAKGNPGLTVFQTPSFYDYFNSIDGFSADVFAVEEKDKYKGLVVVTIQKEKGLQAIVSKRGIIYGGPLLPDDGITIVKALFTAVKSYYKNRLIYLEIRNSYDISLYADTYRSLGFGYEPWLNFLVDCTDLEALKKAASESRMRQIRKAAKNGVECREARNPEEVMDFYHLMEDLYKKVIRKPLWPKDAFKRFFEAEAGKFLLVYYEKQIIGGIMCAILPGVASYELYICGLDEQYKDQYPSAMATWAAIEYNHRNGIPLFDFMGAGSPKVSYGVREFKARFGGLQVEYGRLILVFNPVMYRAGKLGLSVLKKLK